MGNLLVPLLSVLYIQVLLKTAVKKKKKAPLLQKKILKTIILDLSEAIILFLYIALAFKLLVCSELS